MILDDGDIDIKCHKNFKFLYRLLNFLHLAPSSQSIYENSIRNIDVFIIL